MPITNTPLTVSYFIADISGALATFDSIRWWKSTTGQNGLYTALTGDTAQPAQLVGRLRGPFVINGLPLSLVADGVTEFEHAFTGVDPVNIADVIAELDAADTGNFFVFTQDADGYLVITSATTGTGSSIEVVSSEAAVVLGLSGQAVGAAADTPLFSGTNDYALTDQNSGYTHWYRVQLRHSITLDRSELSAPFSGDQVQSIPLENTVVGYVRLATPAGRPDSGRKIVLFNERLPGVIGEYGIVRFFVEATTDRTGYAQVRLIRGLTLSFNVVGTGVTRKITVPDSGDDFNLLDPALVSDDEFGIHYQDVPFATRTS